MTASDAKYGDFLVDHWLKSCLDNVDMTDKRVVILDYGLSEEQRAAIDEMGAERNVCQKDGHVVISRFKDAADYLEAVECDQVLMCDGGDIIFQADIGAALSEHFDTMRACYDHFNQVLQHIGYSRFFSKEDIKKMKKIQEGRSLINAGVLIGPRERFIKMCKECWSMITNKEKYGPDQIAIDYLLHRDGFKELAEQYNFVFATARTTFKIKEGVFYSKAGEVIPIVHNAGNLSFFRPIDNFGYGEGFNKTKIIMYPVVRTTHRMLTAIKNRT